MALIPKERLPLFKRGEDVGSEQLTQMQEVLRTSINTIYARLESIRNMSISAESDVQSYKILSEVKRNASDVRTLTNAFNAAMEEITNDIEQLSEMIGGFNEQIIALDESKARRSDLVLMLKDLQECKDYADFIRSEYYAGNLTGATFTPSVDGEGNITWTNDKGLPNPAAANIRGPRGFGPQISVIEDTGISYRLRFSNGESTVETPNLKGADGSGSGDMLKSVYDKDNDGVVDNAKKIDGKSLSDLVMKAKRISAVITTTWNGSEPPYTQSIAVAGVTPTSIIEISLASSATPQQESQWDALRLKDGGQTNDQITLKASGQKNTVNIPINIILRGD